MASGDYSTAHGKKNLCTSLYAFAAGYNNKVTHTIDYTAIALGGDNKVKGGIALGAHNSIAGYGALGTFLNNDGGDFSVGNRKGLVIGYANNTTLLFPERSKNSPAALVVGAGEVYQIENAIECYSNHGRANNSLVAFPTSISLSNKVIVNAITPPQDPNNVTQDDMTLVTKSYMSPYLKEQELTAQADTSFSSASPTITLPTPPSWCRLLQITARVGGRQTTVIAHYDPTPGVPHTIFSVDCLMWNDNSEVFEHNWCEFEYDNTTNSITWTNYVQWTHNLPLGAPGTTTLLKKGIASCDTTVYPVTLKSVIAIA